MNQLAKPFKSNIFSNQIMQIQQSEMSHILASEVLDEQELFVWQNLEAKTHRQQEWLRGRYIAKVALQIWIQKNHKRNIDFKQLHIHQNDLGKPVARTSDFELPDLSITHGRAYSLSVVAHPRQSIGLDYENLSERAVGPWLARAFRDEELKTATAIDPESLILLWTAKEAASKAFGTGLRGRWRDWVVTSVKPSKVVINYQDYQFEVQVERVNQEVLGVCHWQKP